MKESVLMVGSGGREHAFLWKLAQSPRVGKLYAAPGNGGMWQIAQNIPIAATDVQGLARFAHERAIGLTLVGPEDPLALGIVDEFQRRGLRIVGPTRMAEAVESSKAAAKIMMREAAIPTAPFRTFCDYGEALAHVNQRGAPMVVKADGLATGKGVYPCRTIEDAEKALYRIMVQKAHGEAGSVVVIEDFLEGEEISLHAFCDGISSVLFPPSQDYKRIGDGDQGENTGGMGAIAPVPWVSREMMGDMSQRIVEPALGFLRERGRPFSGIFYPGLMMTREGPKVLEFNGRGGDPEIQAYMRILKTDLFEILNACARGTLAQCKIEWHAKFAVCVVLASVGYPHAQRYKDGIPIYGIPDAEEVPGVVVFHAGTRFSERTSGAGRVLGVSATGDTLGEALARVYEAVEHIRFEGMYYRRDIGRKLVVGRP